MKKNWRIVQHIYEGTEDEPTLTHVFYGETRVRAEQVFQAHMETDSFMRGCVQQKRFKDFSCNTTHQVEYADAKGEWRKLRVS